MKKLLFILLVHLTVSLFAQTLNYHRNFSKYGDKISSIVYGNSLFHAFTESIPVGNPYQFVLQKNDLKGNPVLVKMFSECFGGKLEAHNGYLYLTGVKSATQTIGGDAAFVAKFDTATLNMIYIREIRLSSLEQIFDSKVMSNGDVVLVGSSYPGLGLVIGVNSTNANVIYTKTLTINPAYNIIITSVTEISNSSVLLTGAMYTSPYATNFIAKALKTATSFTIDQLYLTDCGLIEIDHIKNTNKAISYGNEKVYVLDTNLFQLNNAKGKTLEISSSHRTMKFLDNKIYRLFSDIQLGIIDTSMTEKYCVSYPGILTTFTSSSQVNLGAMGDVSKSGNNIFVSYFPGQSKLNMLKTDLNGKYACSVDKATSTQSLLTNTSVFTSFTFTDISSVTGTHTVIPTMDSNPFTDGCPGLYNAINQNDFSGNYRLTKDREVYFLSSTSAIIEFSLIDITGKVLKHLKYDSNQDGLKIDLSEYNKGIYVAKILMNSGEQRSFKLIN